MLFATCRDELAWGGTARLVKIREQFERSPGPNRLLVQKCSEYSQCIFATRLGETLLTAVRDSLLADGRNPLTQCQPVGKHVESRSNVRWRCSYIFAGASVELSVGPFAILC